MACLQCQCSQGQQILVLFFVISRGPKVFGPNGPERRGQGWRPTPTLHHLLVRLVFQFLHSIPEQNKYMDIPTSHTYNKNNPLLDAQT